MSLHKTFKTFSRQEADVIRSFLDEYQDRELTTSEVKLFCKTADLTEPIFRCIDEASETFSDSEVRDEPTPTPVLTPVQNSSVNSAVELRKKNLLEKAQTLEKEACDRRSKLSASVEAYYEAGAYNDFLRLVMPSVVGAVEMNLLAHAYSNIERYFILYEKGIATSRSDLDTLYDYAKICCQDNNLLRHSLVSLTGKYTSLTTPITSA